MAAWPMLLFREASTHQTALTWQGIAAKTMGTAGTFFKGLPLTHSPVVQQVLLTVVRAQRSSADFN